MALIFFSVVGAGVWKTFAPMADLVFCEFLEAVVRVAVLAGKAGAGEDSSTTYVCPSAQSH